MEERKGYSVIGTVTIGTDEYRDLVENAIKSAALADDYRSKYWAEQNKVTDLKKQVEALNAKVVKCEKFFKNNHDASGDIISVFMSIFGEE